jgi:hypothetical protein
MKFFVVVKKSTPGDIGYLKFSHSSLIQNGGGSKLCLLHCGSVGRVREHGILVYGIRMYHCIIPRKWSAGKKIHMYLIFLLI